MDTVADTEETHEARHRGATLRYASIYLAGDYCGLGPSRARMPEDRTISFFFRPIKKRLLIIIGVRLFFYCSGVYKVCLYSVE